jgi:hypothetical protein
MKNIWMAFAVGILAWTGNLIYEVLNRPFEKIQINTRKVRN